MSTKVKNLTSLLDLHGSSNLVQGLHEYLCKFG